MRVIDCSTGSDNIRSHDSLPDWLTALKSGRSSAQDLEAQETVLGVFQRLLDNKYTMLQNVSLDGLEFPVPLVLVGPTGVWAFVPSGLRGVYRARGDSWEKIDDRQHSYTPTGENLLTRTSVVGSAVQTHIAQHGFPGVQVEPVLVFTNPGIHVETVRPITRVVLVDALERFATGIVQGRMMHDQDQVQGLLALFLKPDDEPDASQAGAGDKPAGAIPRGKAQVNKSLDRFDNTFSKLESMPFSSKQWIIIGILMLINIIILAGFVIYILIVS